MYKKIEKCAFVESVTMMMNIEKYWKKVVIFNYRYQVNQRRYYNNTITTTTIITDKTTTATIRI